MSYVLSDEARLRVVHALCEGASINATVRQTAVSKGAILRLLERVGEGAARVHNRMVRGVSSALIECDEIWSYVGKKASRVTEADAPGIGEAYCFVAIDINTRLILSYLVGKRDAASTERFIDDLRSRVTVMPQINTDGWAPYVGAILKSFGASVNYGMVRKNYHTGPRRDDHRYEPSRDVFITKLAISGAPDMDRCSTVHVESQNLTMRMHIRRLTRLCNAYSKKRENHCAAIALHFLYYSFVKVHSALRTTPAVAAKLAERPWTVAEMIAACLEEPAGEAPKAMPLALPDGQQGAARELPGGRGWLRVVRPATDEPAGKAASVVVPLAARLITAEEPAQLNLPGFDA